MNNYLAETVQTLRPSFYLIKSYRCNIFVNKELAYLSEVDFDVLFLKWVPR